MLRLALRCAPLPLVILIAVISTAQTVTPAPASSEPSPSQPEKQVTDSEAKPDYSKEAFVIERMENRYRFENDGSGSSDNTLRVRVLSESGVKGFGQLRFGYNSANDTLEILRVKVTKPDGSIVNAGPEAVQDLTAPVQQIAPVYTDYREKHITVPGLRPGDTLEWEVKTTFLKPLAPGQFWTQHDFNTSNVVLDEQLEINIPLKRVVKLKNRPGLDPKITEENGRRIYRWTSSHLSPTVEPRQKEKDKKRKKKADEIPDVQMTTFTSWEEVGRWYAALEKDRRVPTEDIRAKSLELTKGLNSDIEKTEALYDFVAQNFRYVSLSLGLGRYQPQAAADVLRNQYGDCKDKNTLLAALLEAQGLHSASVLINSFRKLDPDIPSPSQFNHVITMVPVDHQKIWLDTTTEVAPFRLLAYPLRKKEALVIPPNNDLPHLEETPVDPPTPDAQQVTIDGKIDDTGKLEAKITDVWRGDVELALRMLFRSVPAAKWQTLVEGLNKGLGGEVSNPKVTEPTATREPFTISYDISKANFADWSKKKNQLRLPLSVISLVAAPNDVDETTDNGDKSAPEPFKLGPPNEHTYRLKLELAPRYHADTPVPVTIARDYGHYESSYKIDGTTFTAERALTVVLGELPPSRSDDYRAFRRSVLGDYDQPLVLDSALADTHSAPSDLKPAELVHSGNEARNNGNYELAIDLYNRAIGADPKNKDAWNDLGLAYYAQWQDGLAINAYQKQIQIDAYDQYVYNNLARVYLRQRNYEEADKWFNKQIEVNPLDKYAHANLGISLMEQHKYEDALPELEKAASISPGVAARHVNLGQAYLNLGQDEKAMAAFDKALTVSANAATWNSIAYQLASKKVHLDLARSYAESAVSSTSASLRSLSPEQVKRSDALRSSSLSAYWDTLGWVAFAEGKIDVAERYVRAAWQLGEHADEADHLAQIYEKRGQKSEAAHFYALALIARRPDPEIRTRLSKIVGSGGVDAELTKYRAEFEQNRSLHVPNPSSLAGNADFFIVLSGSTVSSPSVEGVSFVNGEEKLKSSMDALRAAIFVQSFPDDNPVRIVRRGTLTCQPKNDCSFALALPEDVRSID